MTWMYSQPINLNTDDDYLMGKEKEPEQEDEELKKVPPPAACAAAACARARALRRCLVRAPCARRELAWVLLVLSAV